MKKLKSTYTETRELKSDVFVDHYGACTHLSMMQSIKWVNGEIEEVKFIIKSTSDSSCICPFSVDFECYSAASKYFESKSNFYKDIFNYR